MVTKKDKYFDRLKRRAGIICSTQPDAKTIRLGKRELKKARQSLAEGIDRFHEVHGEEDLW